MSPVDSPEKQEVSGFFSLMEGLGVLFGMQASKSMYFFYILKFSLTFAGLCLAKASLFEVKQGWRIL